MKKILFIAALLVLMISCVEKKEVKYAEETPVRQVWQISIYERTLDAEMKGFIEEGEDSVTVEALRKEAEDIDSMVVSCLLILDAKQDTVINMYDIK